MEDVAVQPVFLDQSLKGPALLAGALGGAGDIALMEPQQIDQIGPFELLDRLAFDCPQQGGFPLVLSMWDGDVQVVHRQDVGHGEKDRPMDHRIQFPHVSRPMVVPKLMGCPLREWSRPRSYWAAYCARKCSASSVTSPVRS